MKNARPFSILVLSNSIAVVGGNERASAASDDTGAYRYASGSPERHKSSGKPCAVSLLAVRTIRK